MLAIHGHDVAVYGVAFSPDGRLLATSSPDGTTALHLLPVEELVELARERVTRDLTDEECRRFLHLERCPPEDAWTRELPVGNFRLAARRRIRHRRERHVGPR